MTPPVAFSVVLVCVRVIIATRTRAPDHLQLATSCQATEARPWARKTLTPTWPFPLPALTRLTSYSGQPATLDSLAGFRPTDTRSVGPHAAAYTQELPTPHALHYRVLLARLGIWLTLYQILQEGKVRIHHSKLAGGPQSLPQSYLQPHLGHDAVRR